MNLHNRSAASNDAIDVNEFDFVDPGQSEEELNPHGDAAASDSDRSDDEGEGDAPAPLSEYELERLLRIREHDTVIASLGLTREGRQRLLQ